MPTFFTVPRHAATPCIERIEWLTDVQIARDGTELRRTIREIPRYTYSFDVIASNPGATAILDTLRTETEFHVPAWCHAFQAGTDFADALDASHSLSLNQLTGEYEELGVYVAPDWSVASLCAPYFTARYAGDSRQRTYINGRLHTASVSFVARGLIEDAYYYGKYYIYSDLHPEFCSIEQPLLPLLDFYTQSASGLTETVDTDANYFDNGLLDIWQLRFIKRSKTAQITLAGREQILNFRQLMFFLAGRRNPVRWKAPGDDVEKTWRLASDAVEFQFMRPNLCTVALQLTEITA